MAENMKKGLLITFEGPEGSGKSTQSELIYESLEADGYPSLRTAEPGGTALGERIRNILLERDDIRMDSLAELFLFQADRAQHVEEVIRPALDAGTWVLCSRFFDSTTAYQGYGAGLDLKMLNEINAIASGSLVPDLTIVFDLDPEKGLERVSQRGIYAGAESGPKDRMEDKKLEFHQRVRKGFIELADRNSGRIKVVDASGDENQVLVSIKAVIDGFLSGSHRQEDAE